MKDSSRSAEVLKKILRSPSEPSMQKPSEEKLIEEFFLPNMPITKKVNKKPGRPTVEDHLKAKNLTLCLAPKYVAFLDSMKMKDKKIQGRGRKIRFIIDQFMEMHKRQKLQLGVLSEALAQVEKVLSGFSTQAKKGQTLNLSIREKAQISQAAQQVKILMTVLKYSPKDLGRMLTKNDNSLLSFCLNWEAK